MGVIIVSLTFQIYRSGNLFMVNLKNDKKKTFSYDAV